MKRTEVKPGQILVPSSRYDSGLVMVADPLEWRTVAVPGHFGRDARNATRFRIVPLPGQPEVPAHVFQNFARYGAAWPADLNRDDAWVEPRKWTPIADSIPELIAASEARNAHKAERERQEREREDVGDQLEQALHALLGSAPGGLGLWTRTPSRGFASAEVVVQLDTVAARKLAVALAEVHEERTQAARR